jgi:chromosome condensin MukBEF ATPase and DNA-binding subunit MukB
MKWTGAVLVAALAATSAWAQNGAPHSGDAGAPSGEQWQKRARLMRTLAIADALELDDAAALKLRDRLARFEEKRSPLHIQLLEQTVVLRRAAKGDTTAYAQVDGAVQKVLTLRAQLEQMDRELFAELSAGLTPQKKARLALAMARLPQQLREMAQDKGHR